jgi:hypothetical protein
MGRAQQFLSYFRCPSVMPKPNPLLPLSNEPRPVAAVVNPEQLQRHQSIQRTLVVLLGCLWLLAFATGCGRNTKNCSAYDGVVLPDAQTEGTWDGDRR